MRRPGRESTLRLRYGGKRGAIMNWVVSQLRIEKEGEVKAQPSEGDYRGGCGKEKRGRGRGNFILTQ